MIPTEQVMDEAIADVGGKRVSSLIPDNGRLNENADYLCYQHYAILELKSLQTALETPSYQDKLRELAYGWAKIGLIPFSARLKLNLPTLPEPCQQEWIRLLTQSLQLMINKTNRHIRNVKNALNLPNFRGVLLLANDCAIDLEPYNVIVLVANILRKTHSDGLPQYSSIDAVTFLSCNLPIVGTESKSAALWWFSSHRPSSTKLTSDLLAQIGSCWFNRLSQRLGYEIRRMPINESDLESLTYSQKL